jgi:hypothetical protein
MQSVTNCLVDEGDSMRRVVRRSTGLRQGRFYRLLEQVQAIPAGVYRFEGARGCGMEFSVGAQRSVRFTVKKIDTSKISLVSYRRGQAQRYSESEFFDRVYENIEKGVVERVSETIVKEERSLEG